ncbi:MAG TPA: hypothetical protein VGG57_04610 [Stellaceae bacterium]|jgi:hypothetical protein
MADGPTITEGKRREQAAREVRLAKALRANLARRKEQVRARETPDEAAGPAKPPA